MALPHNATLHIPALGLTVQCLGNKLTLLYGEQKWERVYGSEHAAICALGRMRSNQDFAQRIWTLCKVEAMGVTTRRTRYTRKKDLSYRPTAVDAIGILSVLTKAMTLGERHRILVSSLDLTDKKTYDWWHTKIRSANRKINLYGKDIYAKHATENEDETSDSVRHGNLPHNEQDQGT